MKQRGKNNWSPIPIRLVPVSLIYSDERESRESRPGGETTRLSESVTELTIPILAKFMK